ncbi:MAG: hypothetical protein ACXACX_02545 [Candidatus Hodarchaeales archaeon]|jgi:hypothetical protein
MESEIMYPLQFVSLVQSYDLVKDFKKNVQFWGIRKITGIVFTNYFWGSESSKELDLSLSNINFNSVEGL